MSLAEQNITTVNTPNVPDETWAIEHQSSIIVGGPEASVAQSLIQMAGLMPRAIDQQIYDTLPFEAEADNKNLNVRVGWVPMAAREADDVRGDVNSLLNQFAVVMRAQPDTIYLETARLNEMIMEQRIANVPPQPFMRTQYAIDLMSGQKPLPRIHAQESMSESGVPSFRLKFVPNLWQPVVEGLPSQ